MIILFYYLSFTQSLMDFTQTRSSNRVYARSGMIPKYTGYIPRKFIREK
jgi:hypothetical protein